MLQPTHPCEDFLLFKSLKSHRLIAGWPEKRSIAGLQLLA